MTIEEMTAQLEALLAARYRGLRTVEIDGRRVTYTTDAEMAAAITDLERRIALAGSDGRRRRILTSASKKLLPRCARIAAAIAAPCRRLHRRLRRGALKPQTERLPTEPRASQHADRRCRPRHHRASALARAQQRLRR